MDFLTRLVERQRTEQIGVRPVLPSRYERDAVGPTQPESAARPTEPNPRAVAPAPSPTPAKLIIAADAKPIARQPDAEHPSPSPAGEPAVTPPAPEPPRVTNDPLPVLVVDPVPIHDDDAHTDWRQDAEHQPLSQPATVVQQQVTSRTGRHNPVALDPIGPAEPPQPMIVHDDYGAPITMPPLPERDSEAQPTTIAITIGRVELRAPAAHTDQSASATPAPPPTRPAYRPRLTLEDYLARPNRGRR
jgi:hypothetical protein